VEQPLPHPIIGPFMQRFAYSDANCPERYSDGYANRDAYPESDPNTPCFVFRSPTEFYSTGLGPGNWSRTSHGTHTP